MFGNYQISRKIPRLDDSELVWEPEKNRVAENSYLEAMVECTPFYDFLSDITGL